MQFISNATLSQLGLDPASTNVYGYGGRQRPDCLAADEPDDLPLLPSVKTTGGIIFFGTDHITWTAADARDASGMAYQHSMHPYGESSFYYLSDRTLPEGTPPMSVATDKYDPAVAPSTTFTVHMLHEKELEAPSNTGRIMLGEDFRSNTSQKFSFSAPGIIGNATAKVRFGSNITNGSASLMFTSGGKRLDPISTDVMPGLTSSTQFLKCGTTVRVLPEPGESIELGITCSASGSFTILRLDYIEMEYERKLDLGAGPLHFYANITKPTSFSIAAAPQDAEVWDVTNPARPILVSHRREGDRLLFTTTAKGYREFTAFAPSMSGWARPATPTQISNQDIHGLPNPDMIIIAPALYSSHAEEVAQLHRSVDGMTVHVLTPQDLYTEFSSGTPDAGAFRKALKMWGDRANADPSIPFPKYCLILGRATYDNKRLSQTVRKLTYPTVPIWQSAGSYSESTSYSTDDYIGMIDDSDTNFVIGSQKIRVGVGRWPVKSETEASQMVEKLTDYMLRPSYGPWRNNVMLIADDNDGAQHLIQSESVYEGMRSKGNGKNFAYERLYLDSYPLVKTATGDTYPAAKQKMLAKWNEGVGWINYIGHANPRSWSHEQLLTWTDIMSFSNPRLPILYAATCSFGKHDDITASGAEELLLNPEGGIIGAIVPSRTVYIPQNGKLSLYTSYGIYDRDKNGAAARLGDVMVNGKNLYPGTDDNKLRYSLLGDPALPVLNPEYRIVVDLIDDYKTSGRPSQEMPVIPARGKVTVSGHVENHDGTAAEDYDGILYITLYDAERVITTYGNGDNGISVDYNDRKTKLYTGAVRINAGKWETQLLMPSEIENNYSPALISLYAFTETGREANGSCTQLYVYGYDQDADGDGEGPQIDFLTLNGHAFSPGDITHESPLVLASFSDPSGINISEAGIGHRMMLTLDDSRHFDDVVNFYTPDPERPGGGTIAYPLEGISPGSHELKFTVWDNANNSSSAVVPFRVGLNASADMVSLTTDANPAYDKVTFTVNTDRPLSRLSYKVEVFDLNGAPVWVSDRESKSQEDGSLRKTWYLTDSSGTRVPRGIYLCRATVTTADGPAVSKTIKLAVAAAGH